MSADTPPFLSSTRIKPSSELLPSSTSAKLIAGLVDYTVNIEPSATDGERIVSLLSAHLDLPSITQTLCPLLCVKPAAFSLNTTVNPDDGYAVAQLGAWAAAHFARLGRLLPNDLGATLDTRASFLPTHPLVSGNTHPWNLLLAYKRTDGDDDDSHSQVLIINPAIELGNTRSLTGIYKLVASLRCLANWSTNNMWPR